MAYHWHHSGYCGHCKHRHPASCQSECDGIYDQDLLITGSSKKASRKGIIKLENGKQYDSHQVVLKE